ncbi:hypothetical protein CDAR_407611 [Caerostris darwini]|uniref:Uncharacterized protein n=1 Tax=Caerostris darwini TaxID=1538125 RepID=A0AAV4Q3B3_9ARAC|nr:hypothetical protein CDAR_407611 [Caerostris darwini]
MLLHYQHNYGPSIPTPLQRKGFETCSHLVSSIADLELTMKAICKTFAGQECESGRVRRIPVLHLLAGVLPEVQPRASRRGAQGSEDGAPVQVLSQEFRTQG